MTRKKTGGTKRLGTVLPRPEHRFRDAKIGMTYKDSAPDYPELDKAPPSAPNIVIVLLDDAGYGVSERVRRARPDAGRREAVRSRACSTASSTRRRCARRRARRC